MDSDGDTFASFSELQEDDFKSFKAGTASSQGEGPRGVAKYAKPGGFELLQSTASDRADTRDHADLNSHQRPRGLAKCA